MPNQTQTPSDPSRHTSESNGPSDSYRTTSAFPASKLNNSRWSRWKAEQFGALALVNTWLLVVIGLQIIATVFLGFVVYGNTRAIAKFKPIFVRINELGEAKAVYLDSTAYHPQSGEVKRALSDFATKYYTHKKERLQDYYLSKYYLSSQLGTQSYLDDQQSKWIRKLLNNQIEQTEAQVRKVTITNLNTEPYEALVDFQRIVYANGSDTELRREDLTATIRFTFTDKVEAKTMQYNPLGLTITDFHSDQAFH